MAGTLFMTVSSAWLGAGVLLTAMGLLTMRQRGGRLSFQKKRPAPFLLVVTGVVLFTMTLAALVLPMSVDVAGLSLTASGIRPAIWSSALEVFNEAPIGGVGASPFFALAADPFDPTRPTQLWDAHNIYLSILGQFGLVGAALFGGAVIVCTSTLVRAGATRKHAVLLVALLAAGIHGVAVANEEFRHLWALLGLIGLAGVPQWAQGQWWKEEDSKEREGVLALDAYRVSQE
jgi:O-antigen ligase